MVQLCSLDASSAASRAASGATVVSAPSAPVRSGAPVDTFEHVITTVSRTHQIDDLFITQWDTTRCSASSAIAIASIAGPSYLEALSAFVVRNLEKRVATLWNLVDDLDGPTPEQRDRASRHLLLELQRHIGTFRLSMATALIELGYEPAKEPGTGVGVPAHVGESPIVVSDGCTAVALTTPDPMSTQVVLTASSPKIAGLQWLVRNGVGPDVTSRIAVPVMRGSVPWYRVVADEGARGETIALQSKDIELASAAQVLAIYQLTGEELKLVDRMIGCLDAELAKARNTLAALQRTPTTSSAHLFQMLADSLLVAQQHSSGLNAFETAQALHGCGLAVETTGRPVPWQKLARAAAPGDSLLLEGRGHAVTFGRLRDGRTFLYDSEGICGERDQRCLRFVEPGSDEQVDRHYGVFQATHRIQPPRAHALPHYLCAVFPAKSLAYSP